jgi:hypothetical protein
MASNRRQQCLAVLVVVGLFAVLPLASERASATACLTSPFNSQWPAVLDADRVNRDPRQQKWDGPLHNAKQSLINQTKKLIAADGAGGDEFGWSVAIAGDLAIVGVIGCDINGANNQGCAYVFQRDLGGANNWGLVRKLTASDGAADDVFGISVAISGNVAIVGAQGHDNGGNIDQGAAYIFARDQGGLNNWGQVQKLTASDGAANDAFGMTVGINNDTAVVGASLDDIGANSDQGSAYIFDRNQGGTDNWGQVQRLTAIDGSANDQFGSSASVSGDSVAVGSHFDDVGVNLNQGSTYVFDRNQGGTNNWGQSRKLVALGGAADDEFGFSVSLDADTVVVGAPFSDPGGNSRQGSAYVFDRNTGGVNNWGQLAQMLSADGNVNDMFGRSVSISQSMAAIGAEGADIGGHSDQGTAYIFERNTGGSSNWGQVQKLVAPDGAAGDSFGSSVAISNGTAISGAWKDNVVNVTQGSAYVFDIVPSAATATVSGRVVSPSGQGIANAFVYLTDQSGGTRGLQTSSLGYFSFSEVDTGQNYVISVSSKRFQFRPQVLSVNGDIADTTLVADL